eukprot:6320545-Amphidinium_carterae.1
MALLANRHCAWLLLVAVCTVGIDAAISKAAVKHVECGVCEMAVAQAQKVSRAKGLKDEDSILDMLEKICIGQEEDG